MERHKRIDHGGHGHDGEQARADPADRVPEVEQTDGEGGEQDGEVEPGEEGAFVGEEDFGLDPGGEGDAFACEGEGRRVSGVGVLGGRGEEVPGVVWRRGWEDIFGGGKELRIEWRR